MLRVVAKKIVSRFEIFISRSHSFSRETWNKIRPNLSQRLGCGATKKLPSFTLIYKIADAVQGKIENMINKCSKLFFFFNYFTH